MINHTEIILSPELINILCKEEENIKNENSCQGSLEVDRVLSDEIQLIFDGYYTQTKRRYRLLGTYNLITKTFYWE